MPQTATLEDIKAHQQRVEKDKIVPDNLPPCSHCSVESASFKIHAYRDRQFLIIIDMLIKTACCSLVRFKCPGCGKTFTHYPDFAVPHKHYTRQTIESFSSAYVHDDEKTYETSVETDDGTPEDPDTGRTLAPTTIHRWILTLANLITALQTPFQKESFLQYCNNPDRLDIPPAKYKTQKKMKSLLMCRWFFNAKSVLKHQLSPSLQWNPP
jgi:hypothetical protein